MMFAYNANNINFIKNMSNFSYPKYIYKLILDYNNLIFFSNNKSYLMDISDIFLLKDNQMWISNEYDIFEFIKLNFNFEYIIFDNIKLNRFEIEMLREYCKKHKSTIFIFLKNIDQYDFILTYKEGKFLIK